MSNEDYIRSKGYQESLKKEIATAEESCSDIYNRIVVIDLHKIILQFIEGAISISEVNMRLHEYGLLINQLAFEYDNLGALRNNLRDEIGF